MYLKCWPLWVGVGLLAASGDLAAAPQRSSAASLQELRARCPTTRNLAPAAFADEEAAPAAQFDAWQQRIRGPLQADGPPPGADVVLRAFAGASSTQSEPSETATILWRLPDGSWHFVDADFYPSRAVSPPPPPATLTDEQVERARRAIHGGRLDEAQARALDDLLADPCLDAEPSFVGGMVPLRRGVPPMQPCYDAVLQTVEVVRAGRRRVYAQTCFHFLVGELIPLALYPHGAGEAPVMPPSRTLASLQSARLYADQALHAAYGGEAWVNATEAAGSYAFIHRESGFRCAATEPAEIEVFGPRPDEPGAKGGSCIRNSFLPIRGNTLHTEWRVALRQSPADVRQRVRDTADDWFSGYYGSSAHPTVRMRTVTLGDLQMVRAEVAGEPHADARDDELTVVLGAEHDGWTLVARATGTASRPEAVEAAALRLWHDAVESRVRRPRTSN